MTIQEVLRKYHHPETELLLGNILKQSKEFLYLHPNKNLTSNQLKKFQTWYKKRQQDYPLAYLRGYKEFFGLNFKVNKHTLIPRPESEWLIQKAISLFKNKSVKIIEIGTGSGCLAISLAKYLPKANITAVDISPQALIIAKQNAVNHKVKIKYKKQSLLTGDNSKYDLIVANLPYVPKSDYKKFFNNLRHEPKLALVDSNQDMDLYLRLIDQFSNKLTNKGVVLLEMDPSYTNQLSKIITLTYPNKTIQTVKDIHGLDRFLYLH